MLDPLLADARGPDGSPRFYPPGSHPATAQLRAEVERVRRWRSLAQKTLDQQLAVNPFGSERLTVARQAVRDAGLVEAHALGQIARFEEGESVAKADYLRAARRG